VFHKFENVLKLTAGAQRFRKGRKEVAIEDAHCVLCETFASFAVKFFVSAKPPRETHQRNGMVVYALIRDGSTPSSIHAAEINVPAKVEKIPRERRGYHVERLPGRGDILPFNDDVVMDNLRVETHFRMCHGMRRILAATHVLMRTETQRHP